MNFWGPVCGSNEVEYLFIDGGYFRIALEDIGKEFFPTSLHGKKMIDFIDFNKVGYNYRRIFYYDCESNKKEEKEDIKYLFKEIQMAKGFHLRKGDLRKGAKKNIQKGVDIKIAVDMFTHTIKRNMNIATLIAGDLDFKPLIESLVQEGMYIKLKYNPNNTSTELRQAADELIPLNSSILRSWIKEAYSNEFLLPKQTTGGKSNEGLGCVIRNGILLNYEILNKEIGENDSSVTLYEKDGDFTLEIAAIGNINNFTYFTFNNCDILEKYVREFGYEYDWKD